MDGGRLLRLVVGVILAILLVLTIVFIALYAVEKNRKSTPEVSDKLCLTPFCIKAANYLLESIDPSVDPCENFFEFSCGTWLKNNRIPEDSGSQDTINILRSELDNHLVDILTSPLPNEMHNIQAIINAQKLYDSCVNEAAIEVDTVSSILSLIEKEFGGWPILQGSSWSSSSFNFSRLLVQLRQYNHNIIYNFGTSTDDQNSSTYYIRISQGDLALDQRTNYDNETKLTTAYKQFIIDLIKLLSNNNTATIENDVQDLYQFEATISRSHYTPGEQRERQNETVRTTIGNLSQVFAANFPLTNYLQEVYSLANTSLVDTDVVSVNQLDFLRNASRIIDQTPAYVLQNYFIWRFVMDRVSFMPKRYRATRDAFNQLFRGTTTERPKPIVCANFVNTNMGFAVSKVYIKQYFDENARNQSLEMIDNVRNAFLEIIDGSTWMDDESKASAKEKALAIDEKIGYPDYLGTSNNTELERMYKEYIFNSSYINNLFKLLQIRSRENLQLLREQLDRKAWGTSPPTIVNAFYSPSKNQISFPAGILQMPFFNKDAPKYLNYGAIGAVIGHEITHGFDDNGRQYDKDGNRIPWWSPGTIANFNERKKCIVDQYSNYTVSQIGQKVNGSQTQGENIADNGGIKEAFKAYQKWARTNGHLDRQLPGLGSYSAEKMFFINYAQVWCSKMTNASALSRVQTGVHSPGEFRVLGPTSNFAEFDTVFGCKPGQGNSRVQKCTVW